MILHRVARCKAHAGMTRGTRLCCCYQSLRPWSTIILTVHFTCSTTSAGTSDDDNVVQWDNSGNRCDFRRSIMCLSRHSESHYSLTQWNGLVAVDSRVGGRFLVFSVSPHPTQLRGIIRRVHVRSLYVLVTKVVIICNGSERRRAGLLL